MLTSEMSSDPHTVMQILPSLESGGVERGTLEINAALVARGHRSLVVSAGGALVESLRAGGGTHIQLALMKRWPGTLLKVGALRRLLREQSVDLVHVRSRMPAWVTYLAWRGMPRETRPRFLTTVHGLNSVNWYSKVMAYGEQVIAVSHCCRDYVLENYSDTDPKKVIVIHRGVDSAEFPYGYRPDAAWLAAWETEYPQLVGRFVVLLPGRLTRFKGHFDFLQAIHLLKQRGVPVHGLIVGGEDPRRRRYAQSIREQVRRLEMKEDVTLAGHRSDIREVMSVSSAVVSTSIHPPESFGRTVLEAVRLGRPTVGYDHGGVGEVLATVFPQGRVPLQDTTCLADKLQQVYRGELASPAPTLEFELANMIAKEVDLYETMVNGSTPDLAVGVSLG